MDGFKLEVLETCKRVVATTVITGSLFTVALHAIFKLSLNKLIGKIEII